MNAKTSLREFVQKCTRAIECHANAEKVVIANDDRRKTKIKSTLVVERFFQKIYTDAKFKEFQTECLALIYVLLGTESLWTWKKLEFTCSCRIFEHKGIFFRHCIRAMEMTNIVTIPDKYVLNRWRKDVRRKHPDVKVEFHGPDKTEDELRYGWLQYEYENIFNLASTSNELCEHAVKNAETFSEELEQLRVRTGSDSGQDDFVVSTQGSNDATQTDYHDKQNAWDGVENPPPRKQIGRPPSKTPYGFPPAKKAKVQLGLKTQLMEQCMNPFYNTLSQTSSLGHQVPLQFDVHRPPRPDFRWKINEHQHSQGSSTAISSAASSAFHPLHPGSFSNWWTYGIGGTSATGSSSPFTPPLSQFRSGSSTMYGVSTSSNGQPILLPQPLSRAVTSFLPPRPS
ncbi:Protein FAR-RED ELONGATED HYPOCOTYL 3 [Bienertia sinuspersici]